MSTMESLYDSAESQAGYFTTAQALEVGVSRRALSYRVHTGQVEHVRRGIYRLRDFPASRYEDVLVACLWVGLDAVASHETALVIHGLTDAMPATIHLTSPRTFRGSSPRIVVHRADLSAGEREIEEGVPVTTIARTIKDVATSGDPALVHQAVREGIMQGRLGRRRLRNLVEEEPSLGPTIIDVLSEDR